MTTTDQSKEKLIYFHVGTGKTGTTFLQYRVFPKFEGIYYIQRTRFKKAKRIIERTNHRQYLLSREFDQQLEDRVRSFAATFDNVRAIIVFRRHDSYITSQYKRFLKNGYRDDFKSFFDLEEDQGFFRKKHLDYYSQIQLLEQVFGRPPIVMFYNELRDDPKAFIQELVDIMGASVDMDQINFDKKHASYSEKQLKAVWFFGKYINLRKRRVFENGVLHFLWRLYLGGIRYSTLYLARVLPASLWDDQAFIPERELKKIRDHYQADWEKCRAYATEYNRVKV